MKKVFTFCLALIMTLSFGVPMFAGFVSSPSKNLAPELVGFVPADDDCLARLEVVPYSKRNEISTEAVSLIEKAYADIANSTDLSKLNSDLAKLAADNKISAKDLAVSDLFDLSLCGCDDHDNHLNFEVTLEAQTLENFVGLLHMKSNGEWELIKNAEVKDGNILTFSTESFSPFAIVVDAGVDVPPTGDYSMLWIYAAVMAVAGVLLVIVLKVSKNTRTKKDT